MTRTMTMTKTIVTFETLIIILSIGNSCDRTRDDICHRSPKKSQYSNFQDAPKNCGFTTLEKLKQFWAVSPVKKKVEQKKEIG